MISDAQRADQFYAHNLDKMDLSSFNDCPIHFRPKWLTCWLLNRLLCTGLHLVFSRRQDGGINIYLLHRHLTIIGDTVLHALIQACEAL